MQRVRVLFGLLAAIILMVGGAPANASSEPCNPCPPDCPMMAQMAQATADHHDQGSGKSGKADNTCKSAAICQGASAMALAPDTPVETVRLTETAEHSLIGPLAAASRPPDPTLRPPIQL